MYKATLKPKEERRMLRGHLWAYRNEFEDLADLPDGAILDILSNKGRHVGRAFYQAKGGIAARILTTQREEIDAAFFAKRIDVARKFRDRIYPDQSVYRWIFAESDGLPGLIADRYGPLVVAQSAAPFYSEHASALAEAFLAHEDIDGVLFFAGDVPQEFGSVVVPIDCALDGVTFCVDPINGQKTGLFLDQRENWSLTKPYATGAKVLDGHCYAGAWGLHATKYGAAQVLGVDTSRPAIDSANANAERNGLADRCSFERADIREVLTGGDTWDLIVLDPPALAKSRKHHKKALGLYQALNRDAMKALNPGGTLITSSCSQPVGAEEFIEILKRAANAAQRQVRLVDLRGPAPDHPALLSMPETRYLKCAVLHAP